MKRKISPSSVSIRTELEPGDLGYIIHRHGKLYHQEYGYGTAFEAYVAEGLTELSRLLDPDKESVWICEHKGKIVGFLALAQRNEETAQLRYFYLEPEYRAIGLGKRLMDLFMRRLDECGYTSAFLWTTNEQTEAAKLYESYGFTRTTEKESGAFGKTLVEQKFELKR
jgi:ribosomal protein S18 acetylase RimI-like enzyme